jgi:hypothetical protein
VLQATPVVGGSIGQTGTGPPETVPLDEGLPEPLPVLLCDPELLPEEPPLLLPLPLPLEVCSGPPSGLPDTCPPHATAATTAKKIPGLTPGSWPGEGRSVEPFARPLGQAACSFVNSEATLSR